MSETKTWTGMLAELEEAIDGLRQRLDGRDEATKVPAADRHAIERALDRFEVASETVTRRVDEILARSAPRPRR